MGLRKLALFGAAGYFSANKDGIWIVCFDKRVDVAAVPISCLFVKHGANG